MIVQLNINITQLFNLKQKNKRKISKNTCYILHLVPSTGNEQLSAVAWSIRSKQLHTATEHLFYLIQAPITVL